MLNGNILDCYVDYTKNKMITWLINNGRSVRIEDAFEPSFFVYAPTDKLYKLVSILRSLDQVKNLNFTNKKTALGSNKERLVLEVSAKKIGAFSKLADMIDAWGNYHIYRLFNVDLRMPTRYLQSKGVFCNGFVSWDGKNFFCDESQWSVDYKLPKFKISRFDVKRKKQGLVASYDDPISSVLIDNYIIAEENEIDTILSAVKFLNELDPDILFIKNGDSKVLPHFYHRTKTNKISHRANLGRDKSQRTNPIKDAKSYFCYGQIVYRPSFYTLMGRAHIDTHASFMYGESGLSGLIDISRCSNIPLQLQSRLGPGTAISQIQVNKAVEKNYLVPWKKNLPENWKTALGLLNSDRGGIILDPKVGLFDDVTELDFASLYPNIMLKFNISPETMLCSCCKDSQIIVPQLGYNICTKHMGLLPEVLKPIIERRFCFKARAKNKKFNSKLYKEMQMAWKWILIVCFGYTGYRNARYGRIECHESITAFSRDIIVSAVNIAEKNGYEVLHGIIDSLWVKPKQNCSSPVRLSREISSKTGIRMDVEGHYRWIVFLPCKELEVGALNRYYGMFDSGELKVRGIELRQHNTPRFLRSLQSDMLNVFSDANNSEEFIKKIPASIEVMKEYGQKIIRNEVDLNDLIFSNTASRDVSGYKVNTLVKSALLQMQSLGIYVEPGQIVRYVVTDEHSRSYKKRVCVADMLDCCEEIDVNFYLRQIAKCAESILVPFGFTIEKLEDMLQRVKLEERLNASLLPRVRTHQTCGRFF
jgi:DNA polymerase elongation subunit (family B)